MIEDLSSIMDEANEKITQTHKEVTIEFKNTGFYVCKIRRALSGYAPFLQKGYIGYNNSSVFWVKLPWNETLYNNSWYVNPNVLLLHLNGSVTDNQIDDKQLLNIIWRRVFVIL